MRATCAIAGMLSVLSILLWAFAGIPLWASVDQSFGRGYVLFILHCAGLFVGAMAIQDSLWEKQP